MKKILILAVIYLLQINIGHAQDYEAGTYIKKSYMIPMRDGTKLYTVVLTPSGIDTPLPFLIQRTPYGAAYSFIKEDSTINIDRISSYYRSMASEGYIFVFQDIRGRFRSEGVFEMNRPLYHLKDKNKTDESTDAYDTIDWLLKNIANNNGKAGIFGISYPGLTALQASVDPHPALKASSPQASPADMYLGDDFHHNGAFRLSYGFEYSYFVENEKEANSLFPFPQYDVFNWYLDLGTLKNVNNKYYKNRIPSWNNFASHPNYDDFWQRQSNFNAIEKPEVHILQVGGYYDQEDLNGPQIMYRKMEKNDDGNLNHIVLGPWNHGQWARAKADSLGRISFESNTSAWFKNLQKQWFDYWLKGIGEGNFKEAYCFQTGTNKWQTYDSWPPKEAVIRKLYIHEDNECTFDPPGTPDGAVSYVSDPAKPVPYRTLPIEETYGRGSRWRSWQVEDQRFVSTRPDVISFTSDVLEDNLTVTGNIKAHLFVSTTGTDADFVVKLIDVYPDIDTLSLSMSGYEFPVAMEVFRGRFRKSFEKPEPFTPGKIEEISIDLHQIDHAFKKGHRMMIQIQSSWFPVIDRNPQKYVPNIFEAGDDDFIKATQTIYCNTKNATYIELPVMNNN